MNLALRAIPGATAILAALTVIWLLVLPTAPAAAAETVEAQKVAFVADFSQTVKVSAAAQAPSAARDDYSVTVETVIQWPTSDHTVTADGDYGPRWCRGCSSFHKGDDFNPGGGTPVEVIADGVVISAGWAGALGNAVTVRHSINGQRVDTVYGHMQNGSLRVSQGQHVSRGDTLGLVGSTGASTGNHLHFEVHPGGGDAIDPMPWMKAHVNDAAWDWMD